MSFWQPRKVVEKFKDQEDRLIIFSDLLTFQVNEVVQIDKENPGNIECTRIDSEKDNISFRVVMKKDNFWEIHHHDCLETILLYKGLLIEEIEGKYIKRLQAVEIQPYTPHIIKAIEDSVFYVEFKHTLK